MKKILQYIVFCHIIYKNFNCRLQDEKAWFVWLIQENNIAKGHNVSMIEHNLIFWFWPFFFHFFIVRAYCIFNIKFFVSRIFKKEIWTHQIEKSFLLISLTFSYFLKYFSIMLGFYLCSKFWISIALVSIGHICMCNLSF